MTAPVTTPVTTAVITPRGPFSLAASIRFLEGFTPASYHDAGDGVLRLAFPADDGHPAAGAAVWQEEESVRAEFTGSAAAGQLARILSLDVDGGGFPAIGAADPVVAGLMSGLPGLRPVCFPSPYEAAAWAVIGHRIRMTQAAAIKARLAERYGERVVVTGTELHAFPAPPVLRTLTQAPGLTGVKIERLHAIAEAAESGGLDAARLRAMPAGDALAELRGLPGIGPFSAELILVRGAGHPDVFPRHEPRLHAAMARAYGSDGGDGGADAGDVPGLAAIAESWRPYRSWVALLFRTGA